MAKRLSSVSRGTCKKFQSTEKMVRQPSIVRPLIVFSSHSNAIFGSSRNSSKWQCIRIAFANANTRFCDASSVWRSEIRETRRVLLRCISTEQTVVLPTRICHACHFTMRVRPLGMRLLLSHTHLHNYKPNNVGGEASLAHIQLHAIVRNSHLYSFVVILPSPTQNDETRIEDSNTKVMVLIKM